MEEEIKTTEHMRDNNGNVIMPAVSHETNYRWIKRAIISGAFAFVLLVITCVFGISLTNSRAANNELTQELHQITSNQNTQIITVEETEPTETVQEPSVWVYYYEYRF